MIGLLRIGKRSDQGRFGATPCYTPIPRRKKGLVAEFPKILAVMDTKVCQAWIRL